MSKSKIALLGHSGSGKSTCLIGLGGDPSVAEMDRALGTNVSPSLQKALDWIIANQEPVVVTSVHKDMIIEMVTTKGTNKDFSKILFVYLYKRKDRLEDCLQKDVQNGRRSISNACDALSNYEEMGVIFESLADHILDTSDLGINQVVEEIKRLEAGIITPSKMYQGSRHP